MTERLSDLGAFLEALRTAFATLRLDEAAARSVQGVFARLDRATGLARPGGTHPTAGTGLPACKHLPQALRRLLSAGHPFDTVACSFQTLEPSLTWSQRRGGPHASANIMDGHANAMVVGPGGLEDRDDVWVGVSLLAPATRYPDHRHPPEEVYLVLSPGVFRQGEGPWFEPGFGGTFFNEPGILHAMRSGPEPLFAIWLLRPTGSPAPVLDRRSTVSSIASHRS
ncbi:MAG: transcriptional regulator [Proteobacteria bacterium]|nr:transcriptional regulator [Pseudomonadota bacterium]